MTPHVETHERRCLQTEHGHRRQRDHRIERDVLDGVVAVLGVYQTQREYGAPVEREERGDDEREQQPSRRSRGQRQRRRRCDGHWLARHSGEDLSEFLSEGFGGLVLLAAHLDEPFEAGLELVVVRARETSLHVQLQLEHLRVAQLTVEVAVQLVSTVTAIHSWVTSLLPLGWTISSSTA